MYMGVENPITIGETTEVLRDILNTFNGGVDPHYHGLENPSRTILVTMLFVTI